MGADLAAYFKQGKHLHIIIEAEHLLMAEYPETINQAIALLRSSVAASVARSPLTVNTKTSTEFPLLLSSRPNGNAIAFGWCV